MAFQPRPPLPLRAVVRSVPGATCRRTGLLVAPNGQSIHRPVLSLFPHSLPLPPSPPSVSPPPLPPSPPVRLRRSNGRLWLALADTADSLWHGRVLLIYHSGGIYGLLPEWLVDKYSCRLLDVAGRVCHGPCARHRVVLLSSAANHGGDDPARCCACVHSRSVCVCTPCRFRLDGVQWRRGLWRNWRIRVLERAGPGEQYDAIAGHQRGICGNRGWRRRTFQIHKDRPRHMGQVGGPSADFVRPADRRSAPSHQPRREMARHSVPAADLSRDATPRNSNAFQVKRHRSPRRR